MKGHLILKGSVLPALCLLASLLLPSCKGRTAENMVPTGDTVEVVISSPAPDNDSISNSITTDSLKDEN